MSWKKSQTQNKQRFTIISWTTKNTKNLSTTIQFVAKFSKGLVNGSPSINGLILAWYYFDMGVVEDEVVVQAYVGPQIVEQSFLLAVRRWIGNKCRTLATRRSKESVTTDGKAFHLTFDYNSHLDIIFSVPLTMHLTEYHDIAFDTNFNDIDNNKHSTDSTSPRWHSWVSFRLTQSLKNWIIHSKIQTLPPLTACRTHATLSWKLSSTHSLGR